MAQPSPPTPLPKGEGRHTKRTRNSTMTQCTKSAIFLGVAAAAVLAAVAMRPTMATVSEKDMRGKPLTAEFDPTTAASLDILEFDDSTSTLRPFLVAQAVDKKGKTRWSIPSHENYPADAKEQLAGAATALLGLKVLDVAGDSPGEHELYGVLDPAARGLRVGAVGVGTRVTMKDKDGKSRISMEDFAIAAVDELEKPKHIKKRFCVDY